MNYNSAANLNVSGLGNVEDIKKQMLVKQALDQANHLRANEQR